MVLCSILTRACFTLDLTTKTDLECAQMDCQFLSSRLVDEFIPSRHLHLRLVKGQSMDPAAPESATQVRRLHSRREGIVINRNKKEQQSTSLKIA